jgi:hypothetical protein
MLSLFNFFDEKTVMSVYQSTGPGFGQAAGRHAGTVVRYATRYTF